MWVPGRLGAQRIDGRELVPVVSVGLKEGCCPGDHTEKTTHLVHLFSCSVQFGGDGGRGYVGLESAVFATILGQALATVLGQAFATIFGQAFGDDQAGLDRGLWTQGEELPPLFRYALRVTRKLLIEGLRVAGVLAVERLFVHRSRRLRRAFRARAPHRRRRRI